MTPPDEDHALSVKTVAKSQGPHTSGQGPSPVPAEPLPAETRRLPKAASRPAPVLALLRARWPWLVIAGLLGTLLGLLLGASQMFQATAVLRLTGQNDSVRVKQLGQTYEELAASPPVIEKAVTDKTLVAAEQIDAADLEPRVTALWVNDTDLIEITVRNTSGVMAVAEANAVQQAVIDLANSNRDRNVAELQTAVLAAIGDKLKGDGLPAESSRRDALAQGLGNAQLEEIRAAASITIGNKATSYVASGASRPVSAGLGGIGGFMVGAVAALIVGAGRRRVRTPSELRSLAPELPLRSTTQAGEVAGRLLESGHSTLVVLSLPSTPSSASRFAAAVANHLRTHGSSVTLVNAIALESGDASSMALPDEVWVLRRDIRQDVKAYFSTDLLVVACTAEPEAVGLISGQSDLMAVVVAKEGRSTLQQIWDTVGAVESADPIVVLAP
jgi:hypothetical protein